MAVEALRKNDMMAHLMDALDRGEDIGHYGRLVFAMIARHFLSEDELVEYLQKNPGVDELKAIGQGFSVSAHDLSPGLVAARIQKRWLGEKELQRRELVFEPGPTSGRRADRHQGLIDHELNR